LACGIQQEESFVVDWPLMESYCRSDFDLDTALANGQFAILGSPLRHFTPLPFDPWNDHRIVSGSLVTHPRDDGRFGTLLDWYPLSPGNRPTSHWSGVVRDELGHTHSQLLVAWMEREKIDHRLSEVFDVLALGFLASQRVCLFAFGKAFGRSLGVQVLLNPGDRSCRGPYSFRKNFTTFLFLHNPVIAGSLDASSQSCISRRK
jgi:hypothetical protein